MAVVWQKQFFILVFLHENVYVFIPHSLKLITRIPFHNNPVVQIKSRRNETLQWRHNGRKKTSKLRVTGLCAGNSPVTDEFPAQIASNAKNVPFRWRHLEYGLVYRGIYALQGLDHLRFVSRAIWLIVQNHIHVDNDETSIALYYWSYMWENLTVHCKNNITHYRVVVLIVNSTLHCISFSNIACSIFLTFTNITCFGN